MEQLFALSTAGRAHESFQKLYAKPEESYKRKRTTNNNNARTTKKVFGLDCEMVLTAAASEEEDNNDEFSLARASLVEFLP